ncbi:MAG: alpha-2-macroglobulin family protein [Rhizobiaceae bacterium]|nr:alpha-2-macroglobulin family protein [Rhizobiaceae bacterium]MCV0407827.1 alpha-2-macroglobulin family protein [Rhizobiaceae bacterium]
MSVRAALFLAVFALASLPVSTPFAQDGTRDIETTPDADYFGFDLRTEKDVTLDQCEAVCLADRECRAFTYNSRAQWCFLKSDFATLNPFPGAVAGKVVETGGGEDLGAPPALGFLPGDLAERAQTRRAQIVAENTPSAGDGFVTLAASARSALGAGDPRAAIDSLAAALAISPDDSGLWRRLAEAALAVPRADSDASDFTETAQTAALNAYTASRTNADRASALVALARALERGDQSRPALTAYERSLELASSSEIQAEYEGLKRRKGFRVLNHTVEADGPSPRICVQFSEGLVSSGVDYADFVAVNGQAAKAVDAQGEQVCAEGLVHGERYRVTLRQGLPSSVGESLTSPITIEAYVRDRSPSIRFTGDNFVLPASGRRGIPLVSVNTDEAKLELYRVGDRSLAQLLSGYNFLRQLDSYDVSQVADDLGAPVWKGSIEIERDLNKDVTTSFPVDEALPERRPGVYVLTAVPEPDTGQSWEARATQWFVVSDIGLATYTASDGLSVFARSLASAQPLEGVTVTLLARNNEVLGKATTDADGRAVLDAGLSRGTAGMAPAVMMAEGASGDFVFLDMTTAGFDLSDRGVEGRPAPGPVDLFAWTERGIYRPGETVHAAALARKDTAEAVDDLPLTFIFQRPDGVEERRIVSGGGHAGGHGVSLDLTANAVQGAWTLRIHADPDQSPLATKPFLVEDFVPDRIEFDLTSEAGEIVLGETATFAVDGRYLYGAPAVGLALEGEVTIGTTREWDAFPGYRFGLADETTEETTRIDLAALPATGEDGKASFEVLVDQAPATTQLLDATVTVRMREGGGRAVERKTSLAIAPETDMIGIRPAFSGDSVPEGGTAAFSIIGVSPDGERTALDASWTLSRIERNYQWYRQDGRWNYEPYTTVTKVAEGELNLAADEASELSQAVGWGRYRLEVITNDPAGPQSSVEFDAGWYVEAASTETPDALEIALDKEDYAVGETARLQVSPRFAGQLLVTVGADRLVAVRTQAIGENGGVVELPVTEEWGAGAYVTATLYRPGDAGESRMPSRAIGVKWLSVDPGPRKVNVALDLPDKTLPRRPLDIPVTLAGLEAGEKAYVTVAAVDVGILNLTRYEAPDPEAWYFGQRQLGIEMRDLYGRLIDGSLGATGRIRTGGDGGQMTSSGSPPTEKLVAFFSGIVEIDDEGRATVSFDLPQFNGTVRVMAVAWSRTAVGHAVEDIVVRDPVVVTASLPRFMAPGDTARLRLDIANTDGPAGDYRIAVTGTGKVAADTDAISTLSLAEGATATVDIPLEALSIGDGALTVGISHGDDIALDQRLALPVRPMTQPVATRNVVSLAANGGSLRVDSELFGSSIMEGASVSIGVSRHSAFDIPSLLMSLDRYPYGCAEQTTSRALPLLYVSELSEAAGLPDDPDLRKRIEDSIARVLAYQASSGSFGLWSPGSGDLWLDSYVTDFLTRAREQGFDVPQRSLDIALDNLANSLSYNLDVKSRGGEIAYATYVLARNQRASAGDLRYFLDTQLEDFDTPLARAQIAASLSLYGDPARAEQGFRSALRFAGELDGHAWSRADYGSRLRDGAAMLALAAESRPEPAFVPAMVDFVADRSRDTRYLSTQEEAWMLLAARALRASGAPIELEVNGISHGGNFAKRASGEEIEANPVTIVNAGPEPVEAVVTAVAAPEQPLPAGGEGFTIDRRYYSMDGAEANVSEAAQNERFVAVIRVSELNAWPSRVLISDLLPAGFEIDNPRIVDSAALENFQWLGQTDAAHAEFRDDRFVAAFNRDANSPRAITVAYVVRAVTPGTYAHPAASVEDMYRPHLSARTATGMMEVHPVQ